MSRSCRDDTNFCENEGNYVCTSPVDDRVRCQAEGYFPDPYDCKKYFICILKEDGGFDKYVRECKESQVYDSFMKQFKNVFKEGDFCVSPVSICKDDFDSGPVLGNLNLF